MQTCVYVVFLRYKAVIDACSLQPDIDLLPFGDQTEIGERVYSFFTLHNMQLWLFIIIYIIRLNQLTRCMFKIKGRDICDMFVGVLCVFVASLMSFLVTCCCDSGHQPEWRSEAEDLCGQSSLPEHQHRLPGELLRQKIENSICPCSNRLKGRKSVATPPFLYCRSSYACISLWLIVQYDT